MFHAHRDRYHYIARIPPFLDQLNGNQKELLKSGSSLMKYAKNSNVHSDNSQCVGMLLVKSGSLRVYMLSEEGREITLYRLFERDICLFSASCIMNSIQFDISIAAEKDTEVLVIPSDVYKSIMETSAPLANYTNEVMASRFSDVMWLIDQVMWKSFDKRLADFLLNESNIEGTDTLKITHEEIGHHWAVPGKW